MSIAAPERGLVFVQRNPVTASLQPQIDVFLSLGGKVRELLHIGTRIADVGNPSQSQVCFPSHVMVKAVQMFFLEPWLMERLNL